MLVFCLTCRSTSDHSIGRCNVWIQDHILVLHYLTDSAPCIHKDLLSVSCLLILFPLRELGRQRSTIELDTPCVKPAQLQALEEAVNEKIRACVPIAVQLLSIDDPAVEKVCILDRLM